LNIISAIAGLCNAYVAWVQYTLETELDRIEDEIDSLARNGDAASKLRIERLAKRLKFKRERIGFIRSTDGNANS
jgi:CRISPR/Cas system-associated endoribonuclease Cas2